MDTSDTYYNMCVKAFSEDAKRGYAFKTQGQLQEMVGGTHIEKFGKVYRAVVAKELYPSASMEQLWLAFVMKEKYNKTWNGESWVNVQRRTNKSNDSFKQKP